MKKYYKIIENTIRCNHCNTIITSSHVHDMKWCACKKVAVDGGYDYLRRCFVHSHDDYEELSKLIEVNKNEVQKGESIFYGESEFLDELVIQNEE